MSSCRAQDTSNIFAESVFPLSAYRESERKNSEPSGIYAFHDERNVAHNSSFILPGVEIEKPVIVLDPGHGGTDKGAEGLEGVNEKDVVLEFAWELQKILSQSGQYVVVLTRETDILVPLEERVRIAQEMKAALFISLHADLLQEVPQKRQKLRPGVTGATIYTLSEKPSDRASAQLAEQENRGISSAEPSPPPAVHNILSELMQRETRIFSHLFSGLLKNAFKVAGHLNKNPERSGQFFVLKAPDVPSVLLELGYLSNQKDVQALLSKEWRRKTAQDILGAVEAFFASRKILTPSEETSSRLPLSKVP